MGQSEAQSKSTEKPPSKNSDANKISHQNQKVKEEIIDITKIIQHNLMQDAVRPNIKPISAK